MLSSDSTNTAVGMSSPGEKLVVTSPFVPNPVSRLPSALSRSNANSLPPAGFVAVPTTTILPSGPTATPFDLDEVRERDQRQSLQAEGRDRADPRRRFARREPGPSRRSSCRRCRRSPASRRIGSRWRRASPGNPARSTCRPCRRPGRDRPRLSWLVSCSVSVAVGNTPRWAPPVGLLSVRSTV